MLERTTLAPAFAAALLLAGCTEIERAEIGGGVEGDSCNQVSDCEAGLDCANATCGPFTDSIATSLRGQCCDAARFAVAVPDGTCGQPVSCGSDLVCGTQGVCTVSAGNALGGPCGLTEDCVPPLVCHGNAAVCVDPAEPNDLDGDGIVDPNPDGTCPGDLIDTGSGCPSTTAGARDFEETCTGFTDCRRPYICAMGSVPSTCQKIPFFPGPNCIRSDDEQGAYRVYYEIPPDPIPAQEPFEFYRLPFPNDIRIKNGRIDLSGHVAPGEVLGINVAGTIYAAVEADVEGFAINSPIYFRLTDPVAVESLCLDPGALYPPGPPDAEGNPRTWCEEAGDATVFLVNIDPDSPGYQERVPVQMSFTAPRGQYACQNLLAIGTLDGHPLRQGTTYAAVVTKGLRSELGDAPIPDFDFLQILDGAAIASGNSPLPASVITATQPLRDWLADTPSIEAADIVAATVFTTGDPDAVAPRLFNAVQALPEPEFEPDAFNCNGGAPTNPLFACHAGPGRDCPANENARFVEIHGTYMAPAFQAGTRPYLTPELGGAINQIAPKKESNEEMCFALTIPKGQAMPPGGWPVIIVGHGTGAHYRSFINEPKAFSGGRSITDLFSDLGFAVLGFDNVMHGPRQGPFIASIDTATPLSWTDPDNLFFNVINAEAARDNVLQGAVDLMWLTRLLEAEGQRAPNERTLDVGGMTVFDPSQIFYFGHSQGATIVFPYLTEDIPLRAAIISGAGAELALSILNKKEPINIAGAAGAAFGDQNLTRLHPMMGILSQMFGPADAIAYVDHLLFGRPGAARGPIPLLVFSGLDDNYTPNPTQDALFAAMNLPVLAPGSVYSNNMTSADGGETVTAGVVQLAPGPDYDGHFVTFENPAAEKPIQSFLDSARQNPATTEIDLTP